MQIPVRVAKDAEAIGLAMVIVGDRVEARQGKKVIAFHTDPTKALSKAKERIEEKRLRELRDDPEPVLKARNGTKAKDVNGAGKNGHTNGFHSVSPDPVGAEPINIADVVDLPASVAPPSPAISRSIIKSKYRDRYKKTNFSCGDQIAEELRCFIAVMKDGRLSVDKARIRQVAEENGVWRDSYEGLNAGQQRMNVGNRLRHKYNEGSEINIGGAVFVKKFD